MESQPQNPEFMNNPDNFHPCIMMIRIYTVFQTEYIRVKHEKD